MMLLEFLIIIKKLINKKNYKLNSGERQTGSELKDIRLDHKNRYKLAINKIKQYYSNTSIKCLDVFCGNGYGSYMVAKNFPNSNIESIDGSKEAINCAKKYYKLSNIKYKQKIFPFVIKKNYYDYVISLESIEHIKEDLQFLQVITNSLKNNGFLILSTPNSEKQDLLKNPNKFHYKHYTIDEMKKCFKLLNLKILELYGQDVYDIDKNGYIKAILDNNMDLKQNYNGQFMIYFLQKQIKTSND